MQRLSSLRRYFFLPGLLLFFLSAVLGAADPAIHTAGKAEPGSVLQVVISGEGIHDISIALEDERERTLSRAEGFRWRTPTGRSISVALLGIPSTADPGTYRLVMSAEEGRASWHLEKSLELVEKDFPEQVIVMNGKMDALYSDESERKKSESRALWAVLTSFDPSSQFHIGPFRMPLSESVATAGFGDRRRFRMPDGTESSSIHFGRDLWAETGTAIESAGRGRVVLATERFLTGNTVVIEHLPGVFTMYYHMNELRVREGEIVAQGELVGTVGETGFATGEHLHWEMRVGGTPVDPYQFLNAPLLDTNALMGNM